MGWYIVYQVEIVRLLRGGVEPLALKKVGGYRIISGIREGKRVFLVYRSE